MKNRRITVPTSGQTRIQVTGALQELLVPGGELDEAEKDRRQGRAPSQRGIPTSRLYRHESEPARPGDSALLQ